MTLLYKNPYQKIKPSIKAPYTLIYLIRHCHPNYNLIDKLGDAKMPLSKVGKRQRTYLNKKLNKIKLNKIYTSELKRAQETAEVFAKKTKQETEIDPRLNEIVWDDWYKIKYFKMSDRKRKNSLEKYKKMEKQLNIYQKNARKLLSDIYSKDKGKKIGFFCHGNLIKSILTGILSTDVIGFLSIEISQSSISKIVIDGQGYVKINYINNIGHLPRKTNEDLFLFAINQ